MFSFLSHILIPHSEINHCSLDHLLWYCCNFPLTSILSSAIECGQQLKLNFEIATKEISHMARSTDNTGHGMSPRHEIKQPRKNSCKIFMGCYAILLESNLLTYKLI